MQVVRLLVPLILPVLWLWVPTGSIPHVALCLQWVVSKHKVVIPTNVLLALQRRTKKRQKALDVPSKADRVFSFQKNTLKALAEMIAAAGLQHPAEIKAQSFSTTSQ